MVLKLSTLPIILYVWSIDDSGNVTAYGNLYALGTPTLSNGSAVTYAPMQGGKVYTAYDWNSYPQLYESRFVHIATSTNVPAVVTPGQYFDAYWFGMGAGDTTNRGADLVIVAGSGAYGTQLLFRAREPGANVWTQALTANNIGVSVPSTTGTGASGSWTINITGSASISLGISPQIYRNVTGTRSIGSGYTNSTGRPIHVNASVACNGSTGSQLIVEGYVNGNLASYVTALAGESWGSVSMIVPIGQTYEVTTNNNALAILEAWLELS